MREKEAGMPSTRRNTAPPAPDVGDSAFSRGGMEEEGVEEVVEWVKDSE